MNGNFLHVLIGQMVAFCCSFVIYCTEYLSGRGMWTVDLVPFNDNLYLLFFKNKIVVLLTCELPGKS